ncbi:uncharacterized protein LOC141601558 [Silene latifolia]|uniref:uncharacterized protein LOC141601558 n=1 Tax=Silene latifolia TaxID=37657 RepID=UPI003D76DE15
MGQFTQQIKYEWLPYYCTHCKKLGHEQKVCKLLKKKEIGKEPPATTAVPKVPVHVSASEQAIVTPTVIDVGFVEDLTLSGETADPGIGGGCQPVSGVSSPSILVARDRASLDHHESGVDHSHALPNSSGTPCHELVPGDQGELEQQSQHPIPESPNQFGLLDCVPSDVPASNNQKLAIVVPKNSTSSDLSWGEQEHNKLDILGILETKVRPAKASPIRRKQFKYFFVIDNYSSHNNGRVWVLWRDSAITITILDSSSQWIHLLVSRGKVTMEVTFVYGFNHPAGRIPLWDFLAERANCAMPWLALGDWNCVRNIDERISSDPPNIGAMDDFNAAIANAGLELGDRKWVKLDRVLANSEWLHIYPDGYAEALPSGLSDHSPLVISLFTKLQHRPSPFKYLNCWGQDPLFLPMVQKEWQSGISGCKMYVLVQHLRKLKTALKSLHKESYSGIHDKVRSLQQRLELCQVQLQHDPVNSILLAEEEVSSKEYCKFRNVELSIAYQRAKEFDIKMGDASTSYFYSKIAGRRNSSLIAKVRDLQGNECTETKDIEAAFLDYYTNFLGAEDQVKVNKSPGPDGYSSGFFKAAWNEISASFISAILDFFQTGKLLKEVNSTLITLIPKGNSPATMMDYRPISCCSIIYKTISKILTSRLKKVMPLIVGKEQSAFVGERSIFDNTLLANELVRGYGRKYKTPRCMIKVDIRKAFDTVNWSFLKSVLPLFGIPSQFCHWILTLITSPRYSLRINGAFVGYFEGKRGLRQGDPLSPLLFVLCMEILSRILRRITQFNHFSYHPKCVRIYPTHLIFADDLLVFARGDLPSILAVQECLQLFSDYCGLTPNPTKTNIYFAGVQAEIKALILASSGYMEGAFPFKYLGTPLHVSRLTRDMFQPLLAKIRSKLGYWASQQLTYAGKVQLLSSIIFGIESFWCACILLPKGIIHDIERTSRQFLWGDGSHNRMIFFSWQKVCRARSQGGFDIREILSWNKTLLLKLFWKFQFNYDSVWMQWSKAYLFQHQSGWDIDHTASPIWNYILTIRDDFIAKVGSLDAAQALFQEWHARGKLPLAKIYNIFRGNSPTLKWMQPLMDGVVTPQHAFISTLAAQGALPTTDNICTRGLVLISRCVLCYNALETHQHLFFGCPYSNIVMQGLLHWQGIIRRILSLKHELYKLAHYRCRTWRKRLACCAIAAGIYGLWHERNRRIFVGTSRSAEQLLRWIKYCICLRMYAWNKGILTYELSNVLLG